MTDIRIEIWIDGEKVELGPGARAMLEHAFEKREKRKKTAEKPPVIESGVTLGGG